MSNRPSSALGIGESSIVKTPLAPEPEKTPSVAVLDAATHENLDAREAASTDATLGGNAKEPEKITAEIPIGKPLLCSPSSNTPLPEAQLIAEDQ